MAKNNIGAWAFMIAIIVAIVTAIIQIPYVPLVMAVAGIIVAAMNIDVKETSNLLLWVIGMGILGIGAAGSGFLIPGLQMVPVLGPVAANILTNIGTFFITVAFVFLVIFGFNNLKK